MENVQPIRGYPGCVRSSDTALLSVSSQTKALHLPSRSSTSPLNKCFLGTRLILMKPEVYLGPAMNEYIRDTLPTLWKAHFLSVL